MSTNEGLKYREVSRTCTIVGTLIGAVIAFIFTLLIGAFHGFGIVLFLALTWVIGMVLARYCARTDDGDIFGIGRTLGLQRAEREGKLTGAALRKNVTQSSQGRAISGTTEDIKAAAVETKEEIKAAAQEIVEDTKSAVTSERKGDPADVPTAGPPPAATSAPESSADSTTALGGGDTDRTREGGRPGQTSSGASAGAASSTAHQSQPIAPPSSPQPAMPTEAATPADPGQEDDLQRISGVGPQAAARLKELGVTRFEQIAAWSDEDIERMESELGGISGRIRRDDWVGQAKIHAAAK